jgi:hypothetical protein
VAALAVETGIAPGDLLDAGDHMMAAMWEYLRRRAERQSRRK